MANLNRPIRFGFALQDVERVAGLISDRKAEYKAEDVVRHLSDSNSLCRVPVPLGRESGTWNVRKTTEIKVQVI